MGEVSSFHSSSSRPDSPCLSYSGRILPPISVKSSLDNKDVCYLWASVRGTREGEREAAAPPCTADVSLGCTYGLYPSPFPFIRPPHPRHAQLWIELQLTTAQPFNGHFVLRLPSIIPMPTGVSKLTSGRAWSDADSIISYVTHAWTRLLQKVHMGSLQPR